MRIRSTTGFGLGRVFGKAIQALAFALLASHTAMLWAQSPPTIVKAFSAATVALNDSVTLTFTLSNPNPSTDLTGVSFTDNLPSGLIIANPDSLTGTCDPGSFTTGVTSFSLSGGTILASSSCVFSVDVMAISGGTKVNTTDPVTSNEGGTGGTATASVTVLVPDLTVSLSHSGNFYQGQVGVTYTLTVSNVGGADSSGLVTTSVALPAGLNLTAISGSGWSCSAPPSATCWRGDPVSASSAYPAITLVVNVATNAPTAVTPIATVSGGAETNLANDSASDPTAIVSSPVLTKAFAMPTVVLGASTTLSLTLSNPAGNIATLTAISVTDNLPAAMVVASTPGLVNTCGGTATANPGSATVTLSGVSLAPGASCSLSVTVTGIAFGNLVNTATATSANGGSSLAASAVLAVGSPAQVPTLSPSGRNLLALLLLGVALGALGQRWRRSRGIH